MSEKLTGWSVFKVFGHFLLLEKCPKNAICFFETFFLSQIVCLDKLFSGSKFKDCYLRLSEFSKQPYWMEELPVIRVEEMVKDRRGWLHSGHWTRGEERVDYITRLDTHLLYLRYSGYDKFCSGWQTAMLNIRVSKILGEMWSVNCPYCTSSVLEVWFYSTSLRCRHCLKIPSRWTEQMTLTNPMRSSIRRGDLSKVKEALATGSPRDKFVAMLAMEITGLSERKFSSPKTVAPWNHKKERSIRR